MRSRDGIADKSDEQLLGAAVADAFEPMPAEAKAQVRARLMHSVRPASRAYQWRRGLIAFATGVTMLSGVSYAAAQAAPGDLLYPVKRAAQRAYVTVVPRPSTPVKPAPAASPAVDVARPAEAASRAAAPIVPTGRGVTSGTPGATRRAVPATAAAHPSAPETNPTGKPVPAGKKPHPATPGGRSPAPHRSKAKGGTGAKASTEAVHAQGRAGSVGSKAAKGSSADR